MKLIPQAIDNYVTIIKDNYYFFDKTAYIATVEREKNFILLVRPRRMGKTLFSSMLMTYYDINYKDQFQELFGGLAIGKNPTPLAHSFLTLRFDFSHVTSDIDLLEQSFTEYCKGQIWIFFKRYPTIYTDEEKSQILGALTIKGALVNLVELTHLKGHKIYLFIDEYDNFTNLVLAAHGVKAHEEITHGDGFYRDFFKGCKGTFDRIYMTGVSPVTYDDITSGFSIGGVVALNPRFDQAIGVTETELRAMIDYYREQGCYERSTDEIVAEMKPWYDNFCFSLDSYGKAPTIYNTSMVWRYMNEMVLSGQPPKQMLDRSARTDPKSLNFLVMSEDLENREERIEIIKDICVKGYTTGEVKEEFQACDAGDEDNFKSLLYYYGTLTFGGRDALGFPKLIVPNKTMGDLYLGYLMQIIEQEGFRLNGRRKKLEEAIQEAAVSGQWRQMVMDVGALCKDYSSLRNANQGEASVQAFARGLLCLNPYFDVWPELELNLGYSDILLIPKGTEHCPTRYSYLIELKYMNMRDKLSDRYVKEACEQLDRYSRDAHLRGSALLRGSKLICLYMIFRNQRLVDKGEYKPKNL
ncbi:MAG: ATP-binding protein [Bacteroidales bacterium]|nr:ATP-binding protein [Bacteroidales bacterium]